MCLRLQVYNCILEIGQVLLSHYEGTGRPVSQQPLFISPSKPLPKTSCPKEHMDTLQVLPEESTFPSLPNKSCGLHVEGIALLAQMETNTASHDILKLITFSELLRDLPTETTAQIFLRYSQS